MSRPTPRYKPDASGETFPTPEVPSYYSDTNTLSGQAPRQQPQQIEPEGLTEFQKFAASASGQVLPIFGADLFRNVPSTFAPLDLAPVPAGYILGPGDQLRIRVWGQVSFQSDLRIDRSGDVYLPRIGPVHVAGLSFSELQGQLRDAISRVFRNFQLTVDLGQIRAIQVYVTGQARHPGVYTVSALSSLLDALFASGGPSVQGTLRQIQLRREGRLVSEFDLYGLLTNGDKTKDANLQSGDILFIPPVGPQVALTGSVRDQRIYELKPGETIKDLLADAGGTSAVAAETRISVGRVLGHRDLQTVDVSFDTAGLSTPLMDGDLVHVYSIVPRFQGTVTLRGNIANPGKFSWHAGMHVSDLIPDKEALLTRTYWWKRAQLGLPGSEFEGEDRLSRMAQPNQATALMFPQNLSPETATRQMDPNQKWPSAAEQQPANEQDSELNNPQASDSSRARRTMPESSASTTAGAGRGSSADPRPKTEVRFLAPDIDWNYAIIERINHESLTTQFIPFDLGRLVLQHDSSQDLELESGDVVTIFSEADIRLPIAQQSKLVKLEGEFVHAGSYTAEPGETLRDLVKRAGGLTSHAYLYGSEFRRESTRQIQQTRMDEYVRTLEMQMERGSLATAAAAASTPQDMASGTMARSSEQGIISQLRQLRATGRIVLEFQANAAGTDIVPQIPLENGDTFIVPSPAANVNVIGSVYDQNSFLYNPSRRVHTYLSLAGGANRSADQKHEFVIRADGEVISRDSTSNLWSNNFYDLTLNPGDTIVVPEKTFKPSALRGLLDWSQIFSQLALGSAAINVLH